MNREQFENRTKAFALRIIRLVESLPRGRTNDVIERQLLRSGVSVGANYRAACRAKSARDFVSKMGIVEEESDEAIYWIELLVESGKLRGELVKGLLAEGRELLAMSVASIKTARARRIAKG